MRSLILRAVIAVGVGLTSASTSASAQPPQPRDVIHIGNPLDVPLTRSQLASDERFRQSFGFDSDPQYIADLYKRQAQGILVGATRNWGALLTAEEGADMFARQRLKELVGEAPEPGAARLTPFGRYLAADLDQFGGEYFDQLAGGMVVVLFTADVDARRTALAALLGPNSARLVVRKVEHSYAELLALSRDISNDAGSLVAQGIPLSSFGPDVATNEVVIRVRAITPQVMGVLQSRYSGRPWRVELTMSVVTSGETATEAPPMMGALQISNNVATCTSGFLITNSSTNAVMGAGHCGADSPWHQGSGVFGVGSYFVGSTSTFVLGVPGDVEVIPLQTPSDASHYVYISTTSCGFLCTSHNLRVIQNYEGVTAVGEVLCHSLSNEGNEFCGTVTATDQCVVYTNLNNVQVCNQIFSFLTNTPGDSGSPAYQPQTDGTSLAQGILGGSLGSGGTNYTQIRAGFDAIRNAGGGSWLPVF